MDRRGARAVSDKLNGFTRQIVFLRPGTFVSFDRVISTKPEVCPTQSNTTDLFLHVLTATDASVDTVPRAAAEIDAGRAQVTVADLNLLFRTDSVGGDITWRGSPAKLAERVPSNIPPPNRD